MLKQSTQSDAELVAELSTEEQEHLAGGNSWYGGWRGRRWGGGWGGWW